MTCSLAWTTLGCPVNTIPLHPLLGFYEKLYELDLRTMLGRNMNWMREDESKEEEIITFFRNYGLRAVKPDKGGGIVIMTQLDYNERIFQIREGN